jgi:hypothetical protein
MAKSAKANPKKLEQAALKELNAIQITIEASEGNLQRLAALLVFADHLTPKLSYTAALLPWEEPGAEAPDTQLQIDYNAVRNSIVTALGQYVLVHGQEAALKVIRSFGGERVSLVPQEQLLGLLAALETAGE